MNRIAWGSLILVQIMLFHTNACASSSTNQRNSQGSSRTRVNIYIPTKADSLLIDKLQLDVLKGTASVGAASLEKMLAITENYYLSATLVHILGTLAISPDNIKNPNLAARIIEYFSAEPRVISKWNASPHVFAYFLGYMTMSTGGMGSVQNEPDMARYGITRAKILRALCYHVSTDSALLAGHPLINLASAKYDYNRYSPLAFARENFENQLSKDIVDAIITYCPPLTADKLLLKILEYFYFFGGKSPMEKAVNYVAARQLEGGMKIIDTIVDDAFTRDPNDHRYSGKHHWNFKVLATNYDIFPAIMPLFKALLGYTNHDAAKINNYAVRFLQDHPDDEDLALVLCSVGNPVKKDIVRALLQSNSPNRRKDAVKSLFKGDVIESTDLEILNYMMNNDPDLEIRKLIKQGIAAARDALKNVLVIAQAYLQKWPDEKLAFIPIIKYLNGRYSSFTEVELKSYLESCPNDQVKIATDSGVQWHYQCSSGICAPINANNNNIISWLEQNEDNSLIAFSGASNLTSPVFLPSLTPGDNLTRSLKSIAEDRFRCVEATSVTNLDMSTLSLVQVDCKDTNNDRIVDLVIFTARVKLIEPVGFEIVGDVDTFSALFIVSVVNGNSVVLFSDIPHYYHSFYVGALDVDRDRQVEIILRKGHGEVHWHEILRYINGQLQPIIKTDYYGL